jgi:hypothetical protein
MVADETACAADERFFCTGILYSLNFNSYYFTGYDFYSAIPGFCGFHPSEYMASQGQVAQHWLSRYNGFKRENSRNYNYSL